MKPRYFHALPTKLFAPKVQQAANSKPEPANNDMISIFVLNGRTQITTAFTQKMDKIPLFLHHFNLATLSRALTSRLIRALSENLSLHMAFVSVTKSLHKIEEVRFL